MSDQSKQSHSRYHSNESVPDSSYRKDIEFVVPSSLHSQSNHNGREQSRPSHYSHIYRPSPQSLQKEAYTCPEETTLRISTSLPCSGGEETPANKNTYMTSPPSTTNTPAVFTYSDFSINQTKNRRSGHKSQWQRRQRSKYSDDVNGYTVSHEDEYEGGEMPYYSPSKSKRKTTSPKSILDMTFSASAKGDDSVTIPNSSNISPASGSSMPSPIMARALFQGMSTSLQTKFRKRNGAGSGSPLFESSSLRRRAQLTWILAFACVVSVTAFLNYVAYKNVGSYYYTEDGTTAPSGKRKKDKSSSISSFFYPENEAPPRIVYFDGATPHKQRPIELYPTEFSDNTQLYSTLDSDDPALSHMEIRKPAIQGDCVPMKEWQTTFHPSCNSMHEIHFISGGEDLELFGTKGYWRNAWLYDDRASVQKSKNKNRRKSDSSKVVIKTLKFHHNFEDAHFEHDRIDAVAMERLTSSPHVINIYSFCGHSVVTEYADGPRLGKLANTYQKKPLHLLRIAIDIAEGLSDIHGIDYPSGNNATFVHLDVNPANVVSVGGTLKLNDFNIGILMKWNKKKKKRCGFPAQYPNPQWRSPEEAANSKNLDEKVDVFSMGHIFFRLICGHEPWHKLEPGRTMPPKAKMTEKVKQGKLPHIPSIVMKNTDPSIVAIREAMMKCYTFDPKKRPSARSVADGLRDALFDIMDSVRKDKKLSTVK